MTNAKMTTTGKAKNRFHAVTAVAAMAFLAGLSGPATSAFAHDAPTAKDKPAVSVAAASTSAITAAAKAVVSSPKADAAPAAPQPLSWATVTPSGKDLFPQGTPGGQERFGVSDQQLANARSIMKTGQKMGLPPRAWVIAIATSMQESKLENLGNLGSANDHDSLGLFQQRPASGWGTPEQITNPEYAAQAFYKGLVNVSGWGNMSVTDAAQAVQVSAYPDAYAKWEQQAGDMIDGFYGWGPYAAQASHLK